MKAILQRAISLFYKVPVLWVPVIIAAILAYGLEFLLPLLTHRLFFAFITRHSALDGAAIHDYSRAATLKAEIFIAAPLYFFSKFLVIGIFSVALAITSQKAFAINASLPLNRLNHINFRTFRPLLWLSAKIWIADTILNLLSAELLRYAFSASLRTPVAYIFDIAVDVFLGLLIAPMALHFLACMLELQVPGTAVAFSRKLAVATVMVLFILVILVSRAEHLLFAVWPHMTQVAVKVVLIAGHSIAMLPFALFIVCMTLLLEVEVLA